MNTYKVTLNLTIKEGNPNKWNWHELLDLSGEESVWIEVEEEESEIGTCDTCENTYETHSREGRCGDCGNCASCCTHKAESLPMCGDHLVPVKDCGCLR